MVHTECTMPDFESTPMCAFIPKFHWLPFRVWCISGSRFPLAFLVDEGAWIMVASIMVPVAMRMLRPSRYRFTVSSIAPPRSCFSSRCRNCRMVVSSGAGACPRFHARKAPQHSRVVQRLLGGGIAQVEPLLPDSAVSLARTPTNPVTPMDWASGSSSEVP